MYPYAFPEQRTYFGDLLHHTVHEHVPLVISCQCERMVEQGQKEIPPWMFGIRFPFSSSAYCSMSSRERCGSQLGWLELSLNQTTVTS